MMGSKFILIKINIIFQLRRKELTGLKIFLKQMYSTRDQVPLLEQKFLKLEMG